MKIGDKVHVDLLRPFDGVITDIAWMSPAGNGDSVFVVAEIGSDEIHRVNGRNLSLNPTQQNISVSVSGPIETRISLEDLSLEEILDIRRNNRDFVAALSKKLDEAAKDLTEIDTMIKLRMEETGARKFEHAGFRGEYKMIKRGSATIVSAPIARQKLLEIPAVPAHAVDETFT